MSDKAVIGKIAKLLASDVVEKQVAAALVLAELGARDAEVIEGLVGLLGSPVALLQRRALEALGALAAKKALPAVVSCLGARDEEVRRAAAEALIKYGDDAVPAVRAQLEHTPPHERRPLEELLARLGGKDAIAALLGGLAPEDFEGARTAVLPLRARLKEAEPRERRRTADQVTAFLKSKAAGASAAARAAAIKIIGFAQDQSAIPALVKRAEDKKEHEAVRQEAVIALRVAAATLSPKIAEALVGLAEKGPLAVARVALLSLKDAKLAPPHERRLGKLCSHAQAERALLAIDLLGQRGGDAAGEALARTLLETDERARAEAAASAIGKRPDAGVTLARAVLETRDRDRVELLARLLRPHTGQMDKKLGQRLIAEAISRLEDEDASADPLLGVARAFDADGTNAALRDLRDRLRKKQRWARALQVARLVGRSRDAVAEDGYALGALELSHGLKDEALVVVNQLLDRGFDVGTAMRKDRSLTDQNRYDVGFHFIERGHPLGEELLSAVSTSAGRTKLGQMARAKLKSSGYGE